MNKHTELDQQLLDKILFADDLGDNDQQEYPFPLVSPPPQLKQKLYAITEQRQPVKWQSLVAGLLLLISAFHIGQQHMAAVKASEDLLVALHYLNQSNQIASHKLQQSLSKNISSAFHSSVRASADHLPIQVTLPRSSL